MSTILCNISAERLESISALVGTTGFKLSLSNITNIPLGSTIVSGTESAIVAGIENDTIYFYKPASSAFTPAAGDRITIFSTFKFSNEEVIISTGTDEIAYEGRLTVNNINEAFGSFIDKKQIISNARIELINTDGRLSSLFHSYDFPKGATVDLFTGTGNDILNYEIFFSGITNSSSNFAYDDIIFSFSAKDNRSSLLETKIPSAIFDAAQFPDYATYDTSTPIISILCTAAPPAVWVPGTPIRNTASTGTATISYISGNTIYAYGYNNTIAASDTLYADEYSGTSATVSSVTSPYGILSGTGIVTQGDTGHYLGLLNDTTPQAISFDYSGGGGAYAILTAQANYVKRPKSQGGGNKLSSTSPVHHYNKVTQTMTTAGYLDELTFTVSSAVSMLRLDGYISVNGAVATKINLAAGATNGAKVFDLVALGVQIKVNQGDTVTFWLQGTTSIDNQLTPESANWSLYVDLTSIKIIPGVALGGSYEATIPIDLTTNPVTGDGNLFFTRTSSVTRLGANNVQIYAWASTDNFATISVPLDIINSGTTIPEQINGTDINALRFRVIMIPPINYRDSVDLYSLFVSYPTDVVIGSTLEGKKSGTVVPVVYGDFTDSYLPAIKIKTSVDNTIGAAYTFTNVAGASNALDYSVPTAPEHLAQVGDSIEYVQLGGSEKIYAKVTQILPATGTTGVLYFEDFSIVPDTTGLITVARETNTYKICDNPLKSIVDVKYLPKSAKESLALPALVQVQEDLANGELSLIGINSTDKVFVACTGKPNAAGVLLESPLDILRDLIASANLNLSVRVKGDTEAELSTMKLRRYISEAEPFGDFLSSLEADVNIHSYIDATNTMTLIRFTNTLDHDRTYYDHNIVPASFNEEYDPSSIRVDDLTFFYSFNSEKEKFDGSISYGNGNGQNSQEFSWIWRAEDAELIGRQVFNVVRKTPELIHASIAADDALTIKLGDVIRVVYKETYHVLFIYNAIKSPLRSQTEIYGWNLAHGYNIDFPIADFVEFPHNLQTGPFTYSPWLLNNQSALAASGVFDINSVAEEPPLIPAATIVDQTGGATRINTSASMCLVFLLPGDLTINFDKNIAGGQVTVSVCTTAQHAGNTGERTTDTKTDKFTYLTTGVKNVNVVGTDGDYVYIYIDATRISALEAYWPTDNNVAHDRYNWWNPDWPYVNKKFFLSRHQVPGVPPTGLCINVDGSNIDDIQAFKDR